MCLVTITLRGGQNFGSNLFKNQKVTGTTSTGGTNKVTKWTYDGVKYWPSQGHIDFLAYAPYDADKALTGTKINFTVEKTVTAQKDLLWANAKNQTIQTIASTGNKVKFQFKHALSRLGFTVKLNGKPSTDATITLKSIKLAGSATESTPEAFYTSGVIDLAAGSWDKTTLNNKQNLDWFSSSQKVTSTSQSNKDLNTDYLFVIPQDFSETATDKLYVIVVYDIKYNDISETLTNTVHQQIKQKFDQGKAYMINLTIGRPIEFNAEVTPWTGEGNSETGIGIDSWE